MKVASDMNIVTVVMRLPLPPIKTNYADMAKLTNKLVYGYEPCTRPFDWYFCYITFACHLKLCSRSSPEAPQIACTLIFPSVQYNSVKFIYLFKMRDSTRKPAVCSFSDMLLESLYSEIIESYNNIKRVY